MGGGVDYPLSYLNPDKTRPRIRWQELFHVLEYLDRVKVFISDGDGRHSCSALLTWKSTFAAFDFFQFNNRRRLRDSRHVSVCLLTKYSTGYEWILKLFSGNADPQGDGYLGPELRRLRPL